MGQHCGVVCLDLKKYQVLFGDSIGWPVPHEAIYALVKWMDPPAEDLPKWRKASKNVLPFLTPKQQDSGSCGILAAMAIEQHMEDDDLVRAFKKYVKDDTQHPTPEEDMADYLHDLFKFSHPDGLTVKGNAKVAVQDEAKVDPQDKAKITVKDKPKLVVKDDTSAPVEDNARIVVQHKTDIIFDKDSDVDQQPYNEGDGGFTPMIIATANLMQKMAVEEASGSHQTTTQRGFLSGRLWVQDQPDKPQGHYSFLAHHEDRA
ncbi:hypothetical protein BC939DRAFT_475129 [Gamsiella multidivaricata]|uniref:uncharacterized protein n=1 Tax=Gamsiella multidivaricata TaxID=101098 RepID=UPI00222046E6|nr:uncharacterized protein BC939DRAFT_475129 [Gamsiella multidivaricata]KAI7828103.1 hypothetical protein BC939DRAFT_475129 [Gamsiella multidivaricata]